MITIQVVDNAKDDIEREDFFKSLSYSHAADSDKYEVISNVKMFEDKITFVDAPSSDTDIIITLPMACLVLGNAWNKYIRFALDEGLPQYGMGKDFKPTWEGYVQRRMGLQTRRPPEGYFPELRVMFPEQLQSTA